MQSWRVGHDTPPSDCTVRDGEGAWRIRQSVPFHCSTRVPPLVVDQNPTAAHQDGETQATLVRRADCVPFGRGIGVIAQVDAFQRSAIAVIGLPFASDVPPTARHVVVAGQATPPMSDRKSTRLNSSHANISYA